MNFVCGFLFSFDMERFALIKHRESNPITLLAGKWNGIGGKIEDVAFKLQDDLNDNQIIVSGDQLSDYLHKEYSLIEGINERPHLAMEREFLEETGVKVEAKRWHCFTIEEYEHTKSKIYYLAAFGDDVNKVQTVTDEEIRIFSALDWAFYSDNQVVHNVPYLIHMVVKNIRSGMFKMLNPQGVNTLGR